MAYEKTNWVNGETPISAENLNKMEEGIEEAGKTGGILEGSIVAYDGDTIPEGYEEVDNPNVYSTEEKVVGEWFGKPLYRTSVKGTLGSDTMTSVIIGTNIYTVIQIFGFVRSGHATPINTYWTDGLKTLVQQDQTNKNQINIYFGSTFKNTPYEITVFYTKTTD
jgi:hypothetical protein